MSNIDEIPVRLYEGSVEDRHFLSKDEALRYVKDFFNREADKIDQKYNDPNDEDNTIRYDPSHQNYVDKSSENNPAMTKEYGEGVKIYSIFKRKKDTIENANPLRYALNGDTNQRHNSKRSWTFKTNKNRNAVHRQIERIAEKFLKMFPAGFTIIIPASNGLSKYIAEIKKRKSKEILLIDDILLKVTTEEALDAAMENGSLFKKEYKGRVESALAELEVYLKDMDKPYDGYFTRHKVMNERMREVLVYTMKHSETAEFKYKKEIDNSDILLIDDSIRAGQTVQEAINVINGLYNPKSVTVLTLLSFC